MSFKRAVAIVLALLFCAVIAVALISPDALTKVKSPFAAAQAENSISGRAGQDGPVLVVKIDDSQAAHPQIGLEDADIIYIEQVEGGSTRLAAVFSSVIPTRVGPVRSARISDLELLSQYGRVGFAYSGAQRKLLPEITAANLHDFGAQKNSPTIFTTDPTRTPPYAMVLRADLLMELAASKNLTLARSKNMGWNFDDPVNFGIDVQSARVSWPANTYDARWSKAEGRWLLDSQSKPKLSDSSMQLGASTFVIQLVAITDSIYKDKVGGVTPFSATIGTGNGYILRNGKSIKAVWSRPTAEDGTSWKTPEGAEIFFEKGQIWVALTDKEPVFTAIISDATTESSK